MNLLLMILHDWDQRTFSLRSQVRFDVDVLHHSINCVTCRLFSFDLLGLQILGLLHSQAYWLLRSHPSELVCHSTPAIERLLSYYVCFLVFVRFL